MQYNGYNAAVGLFPGDYNVARFRAVDVGRVNLGRRNIPDIAKTRADALGIRLLPASVWRGRGWQGECSTIAAVLSRGGWVAFHRTKPRVPFGAH